MPEHRYSGLDFDPRIVDLANSNAKFHQIPLALFTYDLLNPPKQFDGKWDVVVSNPPYVLESDKTRMHSNVVNYEPASALYVPDHNPLLFYKSILDFTEKHLNKGGRLYLEIHENFGYDVNELLKIHHFTTFDIMKDFRGKDRFIKAIKQN
jgi:release factor glutamine methyltransferase